MVDHNLVVLETLYRDLEEEHQHLDQEQHQRQDPELLHQQGHNNQPAVAFHLNRGRLGIKFK